MNICEIILQEMASLLKEDSDERKINEANLSQKFYKAFCSDCNTDQAQKQMGISRSYKTDQDFYSQLGGGLTFVTIWATWCKPCKEEFVHIKSALEKNKDVKFVSILANPPQALSFEQELGTWQYFEKLPNFGTHLMASGKSPISSMLPTTILFKNKKIIATYGAFKNEQEVIAFINKAKTAIAQPAAAAQQVQPAAPTAPAAKPAAPVKPAFKAGDIVQYATYGYYKIKKIQGDKATIISTKPNAKISFDVDIKYLHK